MRMSRLRPIRRGIIGGILALIGFAILTGGTLGVLLNRTIGDVREHAALDESLTAEAAGLRAALLDQQGALRGYLLTGDESFLQRYEAGRQQEQRATELLILDAHTPALGTAVQRVSTASDAWHDSWVHPQLEAVEAGNFEAAREAAATDDARSLFGRVRIALDQLDVEIDGIRAEALASTEDAESFMTLVILLAVIVYGSALSLGAIWLVRRVAGPLDALSRSAEAMERGEPFAFVATRQDEIGGLAGTMARLHAIVEQRYAVVSAMAEQSSVLNRLSELVSYADDEDAVIRAGAAALERLVPSSGGAVALVNPSFDQLRVHSSWGESAAFPDAPPPIDRPAGCPGIRRNAVHITRLAPDALSLSCEVHPLRSGSLLCVPMISHNEVIGVIHIERADEDAFADDEVRLAGRVAEQVALAMANLRLMRRMERQAMTDPLTGLANPRAFDPLVERELTIAQRDGAPVAIIMLDLDHFKQFNDTHGHPAGDEALRTLARTLRASIRETDTAARYGGEEFAVLLRATDLEGALVVAEKIRSAIELTSVEIGPSRFARVTASLGVAASDSHGLDRMQLMRLADGALYAAKRAGRNRVASAPAPPARTAGSSTLPQGPQPTPIRRSARRRPSATAESR